MGVNSNSVISREDKLKATAVLNKRGSLDAITLTLPRLRQDKCQNKLFINRKVQNIILYVNRVYEV